MRTTNLGDSGYVIYQASKSETDEVVLSKTFRSKEQQYRFNFPYQCGTGCELPYKAFDNEHTVSAGKDFVVMGSDGLFDNLYDEDIEMCLKPNVKPVKDQLDQFDLIEPSKAANCMASKAYKLGKQERYLSPFAKGAREAGARGYIGGK